MSAMGFAQTAGAIGESEASTAQQTALTQEGIQAGNQAAINQFNLSIAAAWQETLKSAGSAVKNAAAPAA